MSVNKEEILRSKNEQFDPQLFCVFCLCCIPLCIVLAVDKFMVTCCGAESMEEKAERKSLERIARLVGQEEILVEDPPTATVEEV